MGCLHTPGPGDILATDDEMLQELKEIRTLLTPKPAPPPAPPKGLWGEFIEFLSKYKVMGMAVAFIVGLYLGALVKALVDDLIMPIIQYATPDTNWEDLLVGPFRVGHFIGALITFIIIMIVIFLLVKMTKRFGVE